MLDPGPGFPLHRVQHIFSGGDGGPAFGVVDETNGGRHLGQHASGSEVAFRGIAVGLVGSEPVESLLPGSSEMDRHFVHRGGDHEAVGFQVGGQHGRRFVLVDHSREAVVVGGHGDSSTTGGDDQKLLFQESFDSLHLHHVVRLRRRHQAAPPPTRVFLHVPAFGLGSFFGLLLGHERSDRFGRLLKGRIVGVHHRSSDHGDRSLGHPSSLQDLGQSSLEIVAHGALGGGHAGVETLGLHLISGCLGAKKGFPNLRAVAVGEHQTKAGLQEVHQVFRCFERGRVAFFHGVPADRNDQQIAEALAHFPMEHAGVAKNLTESPISQTMVILQNIQRSVQGDSSLPLSSSLVFELADKQFADAPAAMGGYHRHSSDLDAELFSRNHPRYRHRFTLVSHQNVERDLIVGVSFELDRHPFLFAEDAIAQSVISFSIFGRLDGDKIHKNHYEKKKLLPVIKALLDFNCFFRVPGYSQNMLTNLTFPRPQLLKKSTSPPSRALANYSKASQEPGVETTDTVQLSQQAKANSLSTSGMRKLGTFLALGLAFVGVMGATGCAGGAASNGTAPAQPETESVQDSVQRQPETKVDLQRQEVRDTTTSGAGQRLHPNLQGKRAEEIAESVGREGREVGRQIVDGLKEGTENLKDIVKDKNAEEIAESIGEEGRRIGQQIGEEGKKVGQEAAKIGKEVGNVAKGFWRGLTGKGKNK